MRAYSFLLALAMMLMVTVGCSGIVKNKSASATNSNVKVIKLGSANSDKHTLYKGYEKFKEIVEAKTHGAIKVEIYPNGQIGNDQTMIQGLQTGTLEALGVSTSILANFSPGMYAFDLPFVFKDEKAADKVLDGQYGQKVGNALEDQGMVFLSYMENGFRNLTNSKHEIKTVDDVAGMKIRTMQSPMQLDIWKAMGANPTPIAYSELFTSMQQHVVDGEENPFGNIALDRFYEVQKYLTLTNHVYNPMGLVMSKKFFDSLTPEEQKIVKEAGVEAANLQRKLNREKNAEFYQTLVDKGMKVTKLTPDALQGFVNKVQPIYKTYASKIGQQNLDEFFKEIKK
ncbi:TRAP transporter substrate-binding protein [Aneurinibacillus sp. Ricciae_BoGa-3]|uniref:TRAP transporter substrate-binding protein n=1 Tax=Aneurinibacillus sp. Ricciae_BoGa-3 TaxID=3022697 RepID=UPI00234142BF|nr:TRAP transporter substrate-binding protein [Aneurinibacillus sp. Ricciae_BoGa-3]WCK56409.1 TRAP transporter substrate-binding protein [Aneurinibacillus sp. Ricciae_BoGa-3]